MTMLPAFPRDSDLFRIFMVAFFSGFVTLVEACFWFIGSSAENGNTALLGARTGKERRDHGIRHAVGPLAGSFPIDFLCSGFSVMVSAALLWICVFRFFLQELTGVRSVRLLGF